MEEEQEKNEEYVVVPMAGSNFIIKADRVQSHSGFMRINYTKDGILTAIDYVGNLFDVMGVNAKKEALFFAQNLPGQVVLVNDYEEEKSLDDYGNSINR